MASAAHRPAKARGNSTPNAPDVPKQETNTIQNARQTFTHFMHATQKTKSTFADCHWILRKACETLGETIMGVVLSAIYTQIYLQCAVRGRGRGRRHGGGGGGQQTPS